MLKELAKRVEGLDVNKSAFIPAFGFAQESGSTHFCPTAITFVEKFNSIFGNVLSTRGTQMTSASARVVSFLGKGIKPEEEQAVEDTPESLSEAPEEADKEDAEDDLPEYPALDLANVASLKEGATKKEAKEKLENYGS